MAVLSTALSFERVKSRRRSKTTTGYGGFSQWTESSGSGSGNTTSTTTNTTTVSDTSTGFAGTGSSTDSEAYASFMNWDDNDGRARNARRLGKEREREDGGEGSSRSGHGQAMDSVKKSFSGTVFAFKPSRTGTSPDSVGVGPGAADGGGGATRQTRTLMRSLMRTEDAIAEEEIEMSEPNKVEPERERKSPQDAA